MLLQMPDGMPDLALSMLAGWLARGFRGADGLGLFRFKTAVGAGSRGYVALVHCGSLVPMVARCLSRPSQRASAG